MDNRPSSIHKEYRYVEGIFEELDTVNEWYLDRQKGILYYYPPKDLNIYKPSINQLSATGTRLALMQAASVYQSQYITVLCRVNQHLLLEGTTRGMHLIDPVNKKLYPVFSNPSAQNMQAVKINVIIPYPFDHAAAKSKFLVGTDMAHLSQMSKKARPGIYWQVPSPRK